MQKKFVYTAAAALMLLLVPLQAAAADKRIYREDEFTNASNNPGDWSYEAEEIIYQDNRKYQLAGEPDIKIIAAPVQGATFSIQTGQSIEKLEPESVMQNPDNPAVVGILQSVSYDEVLISNRTATASWQETKTGQTAQPQFSATAAAEYVDDVTGQTITGQIPLDRVESTGYKWESGYVFDGEVAGYDAAYYQFSTGGRIPNMDGAPQYEGYEDIILEYLELSPDSYRISGSAWDGEAYTNDNGVICRKVQYEVECYVSDFTAYYEGEIDLPDYVEYVGNAVYAANTSDESDGLYTMSVGLTYELVSNTTQTVVLTAVGVAMVIAVIIGVLYILKRKKGRTEIQ